MRDVISSLGRKVSGSSRVAPINLNGEDGPVDDEQISDISHKVGKLIEVYASPKDGETYKRQYKIILRDVGTSSNRELARRTLDFCFSLVSLAQQNNGQQ
ncbi:hypothetical protein J4458_03560 [Candidatus Woesearchaeota archaeon]|nr:hypothetical protein [Candidatus Woesearchaeota archaeon]